MNRKNDSSSDLISTILQLTQKAGGRIVWSEDQTHATLFFGDPDNAVPDDFDDPQQTISLEELDADRLQALLSSHPLPDDSEQTEGQTILIDCKIP
ncbi:MAG: hypothetical protein IKD34_07875 [Oscillospiraceae bacterium]|nr:hypothetical protein [Oscillospiraceae bacterium]MBR2636936.1 hypothetical protein [Oscillospiraceae bacterium]